MTKVTRTLLATLLLGCLAREVRAQTRPPPDLTAATIEELMNIQITSVSRKDQRAVDVAAAVFVLTHDDIRRSGMTSIPELLRLVPGVDVAQINANKWAVSVRGFNSVFANKLLVLVDGRTIYDRAFAGVSWDLQDLILDDIERIEVIRGPGAATWGANAVNGVINIVTRSARDTQGVLARVNAGRLGEEVAVRYGGTRGDASYRVYSQWTRRDESLIVAGTRANDASHNTTTGFRADWTTSRGTGMVEGSFAVGQARSLWPNFDPATALGDPILNIPSDSQGGHILGRWIHTRPSGASLQIQSFLDIEGTQAPVASNVYRTFDVDTQYHTPLGRHQDLVGGTGYRFSSSEYTGHIGFILTPASDQYSLLTGFLQDEISLFANRLAVTLGSQVQYDSSTGAGVQPTARVIWKGLRRQRLWASTSRALRTPSLYERGIHVTFPPVPTAAGLPLVVTVLGNAAAETETLVDVEGGYRLELGTAEIAATAFTGRYDRLQTTEASAPAVLFVPSPHIDVTSQFGNQLNATTHGLEIAGRWSPRPAWRVDGSVTLFKLSPHLAAASQDPLSALSDASAPRTQWQLRAAASPTSRVTVTAGLFYVGPLEQYAVDGYTRVDVSADWRLSRQMSVMVTGQNLLDAAHTEFSTASGLLLATQVPRAATLSLRWAY